MASKKGILQLLAEGPVVGDGSMCMTLEKRGYCTAGPWTPEAVILYPDAVKQLLREYMRAGADVLQTPCFYTSEGRLIRGNVSFSTTEINNAACKLAREVADEGGALICGGLSPVDHSENLTAPRKQYDNQLDVFMEHDVDFLLAEFFGRVNEIELCLDVMKRANKPIAATMRIGPLGDFDGVSLEECAVRMAKTGADIIGLNCAFDIDTCLKSMKRMKIALEKENLSPYLMCQPLGWRCPEVESTMRGYPSLPEAPLGLDPRSLTRAEVHQFTRSAYELGASYIGGCCGMEPHHIRAIAHELAPERKRDPPVNDMCPPFASLKQSALSSYHKKVAKEYWINLKPGSGRAFCPAYSEIEDIGI